jgi:Rrf2 family protein
MARFYEKGPIQLSEIAKRQNVSVKYLEQILIPLKKAGYVASKRGPKGGHMLAVPPQEITVGEIVSRLEGSPELIDCLANPEVCERSDTCPTRPLWKEVMSAMQEKLDAVTLADLLDEERIAELARGAAEVKDNAGKRKVT